MMFSQGQRFGIIAKCRFSVRGAAALFVVFATFVLLAFAAVAIDYSGRALLAKVQGIVYVESMGLSGIYELYAPDYLDLYTDFPDWESLTRRPETRQFIRNTAFVNGLPFGDRLVPYYRDRRLQIEDQDVIVHMEIEGEAGNCYLPLPQINESNIETGDIRLGNYNAEERFFSILPEDASGIGLPDALQVQALRTYEVPIPDVSSGENPLHFTFGRASLVTVEKAGDPPRSIRNRGIRLKLSSTTGLLPAGSMTFGSLGQRRYGFMPMALLLDPNDPHPVLQAIERNDLSQQSALVMKLAFDEVDPDFDTVFMTGFQDRTQALLSFLSEGIPLSVAGAPSLAVGNDFETLPFTDNLSLLIYLRQFMLRQTWILPLALRTERRVLGFLRIFVREIEPTLGVIYFSLAPSAATPGAGMFSSRDTIVRAYPFFWQVDRNNAPLSAHAAGVASFPATIAYEQIEP